MSSQNVLVSLRGVDKVFSSGTVAVRGLDLDVRQGEFLSLLGPSGCGKSTVLRMVAGLGSVSAGTIDWPRAAHKPSGEPEAELGFVFQEPTLMPWATVFNNVYLPLRLKGVPKRKAAPLIEQALEQVGLKGFEYAYPRALSGGMKMRVSIARALVTQPKLLLMDEPFAALDEITRLKLNNDMLKVWAERNLTVIFVTHSVYESVYLSSRVVVMAARPGRVVHDIAIDAPYPRDDAFRTSSAYNDRCRTVSHALGEAMAAKPLVSP
jgi:NitT/TauT family transport system ATP-binding protein